MLKHLMFWKSAPRATANVGTATMTRAERKELEVRLLIRAMKNGQLARRY